MSKALIIVDVQVDFCEGGNLGVEGGNKVAEAIAQHVQNYGDNYKTIVSTRDFHDQYGDNDGHFSDEPDFNVSWPRHCEIGTPGVALHPTVRGLADRLFSKGYQANDYSGFQGRACNEYLDTYLRRNQIEAVDVVGIAGDYCVKATALDAVRLGYKVAMLPSMVASVGGSEATYRTLNMVLEAQRGI